MRFKAAESYYANIWIGGDPNIAKQVLRRYVFAHPLCVTVTPTDFIYTGGVESGMCVRMMNYPRFPKEKNPFRMEANQLAMHLLEELGQWSCSVEHPDQTIWMSRRPEK